MVGKMKEFGFSDFICAVLKSGAQFFECIILKV